MAQNQAIHTATSYIGLIASCLTVVLGIIHVCNVRARIYWPDKDNGQKIIDDVQYWTWRKPLFTFTPDSFLDIWTPFFFGLIGTVAHIGKNQISAGVLKDFLHYFVFVLVQALFANIGYDGGFGIIVSAFSFLACLLSFVCFLMDREASPHLNLNLGMKIERPVRK